MPKAGDNLSMFRGPQSFLTSEMKQTNLNLFLANTCLAALIIYLLVDDYGRVGAVIFPSVLFASLLFPSWNLVKLYRRVQDERMHPLVSSLSRFGDPAEIGKRVDTELSQGGGIRIDSLLLGGPWFLWRRTFETRILLVSELTWVYKKVTKRSFNFIPIGTTYKLVFHTKTGLGGEVGMSKEGNVDRAISELYIRNPNAKYGFSE